MWKEAKILEMKTDSLYRKYKEAACMSITTSQQKAQQ